MNNPIRWLDPTGLFSQSSWESITQDVIRAGGSFGTNSSGNISTVTTLCGTTLRANGTVSVHGGSGHSVSSEWGAAIVLNAVVTQVSQVINSSGGGVTMNVNGNNIAIVASFHFLTQSRIQNRIPHDIWSGGGREITYAEAFLLGIREHWSGTFGDFTVSVETLIAERARDGITVNIRPGYGVSNRSGAWSIASRGTITMFQGDSRVTPNHRYTFDQFLWVSAHEFGHALGLFDAPVGINSIMSGFDRTVQAIDIQMIIEAAQTGRRPAWS